MLATLPDVGAAMEDPADPAGSGPLRYQCRFVRSEAEGGVVADRCVRGVMPPPPPPRCTRSL